MALIINGTTISKNGNIVYNGTSLNEVIFNGVSVWRRSVLGWYTLSSDTHSICGEPTQQFDNGTATYRLSVSGYKNISQFRIEAAYIDDFNNNYTKTINQTISANNQTYAIASNDTSQGRTLKFSSKFNGSTLELSGDWEYFFVWGTDFYANYVIYKIEVYGEPV